MKDFEMIEMKLNKVITHVKFAAVNGNFKMKKNGKEKFYGFCDIYEF